jgi:hypothetical protein
MKREYTREQVDAIVAQERLVVETEAAIEIARLKAKIERLQSALDKLRVQANARLSRAIGSVR